MKQKSILHFSIILAVGSLFAVSQSHAQDQDGSWLGDSAGDWTDGTMWTDGLIANGADFTATFGNVISAATTITLNGDRTIGNITASDTTHNYTLTGNTLTLDRTSGVPVIEVVSSRELTVESIVAGDDGVQKSGGGTLSLKGTNTFSGGLTIKAGTVRNFNTGSGGNFLGTGSVTIGDDANTGAAAALTFRGGNFTSTNPIAVVGTGNTSINIIGWQQVLNGPITLSRNLTVVTSNPGGSNLTFGGGVTGAGNLVLQSNANTAANSSKILFQTGSIDMTGSITNSGTGSTTTVGNIDTTISAVIGTNVTGVTQNSANSRLNLSGLNTFTGDISITAGTLQASLSNTTNNPTAGALGNAQATGRTVAVGSGATLNFTAANVMGGGGSTPKLKLIANGGTIRNTGNIFNMLGPVELNGGTLSSFGGGGLFPSFTLNGEVTVGGSAVSTISTSGTNGQIGLLTAGTTFNVADAVSGTDLSVPGVLANFGNPLNVGRLIKTGVGTMTLSGVNTYTGATTINGGTLQLATLGALAGASSVTIAAGATMDLTEKTADFATYTWNTTSLSASGAGTAATISGTAGGTIDMGIKPISLTTNGTNPSLTVTGAALKLDNNPFTVVVPGPALTVGVYTLVSADSITGTVNPTASYTGGNGLAEGATGVVSISGNNVILTLTGGGGTPYQLWAGPGVKFDDDTNGDGVSNGLAFLLGAGGPNDNALDLLPEVTESGGGLVLKNFTMRDTTSRGNTTLSVEHSSDLGIGDPWEAALVPDEDNTVNDVVFDISGSGTLGVEATIPVSKAVGGKLFGRLKAEQP